jgi:hypothetical protein
MVKTAPKILPRKHPKKRINNTVSYTPFDVYIPKIHPARIPAAELIPNV